jgi:hypothetical protein
MTLAERIIEQAQDTAQMLSHASYREAAYQTVLTHLLEKEFECRMEVQVLYKLADNFIFGHGRIDIVVKDPKTGEVVIVETKANVRPNRRQHLGQLARYMEHYKKPSNVTGLLLYFNGWEDHVIHTTLE